MTDLEPEKDRRVWVLRWVTDEAFWRSVMAQTIAGVIVATVAALYVAASGYLEFWAVVRVLAGFLCLIVAALVILLPVNRMQKQITETLGRARDRGRFGRVLTGWIIAGVLWAATWTTFAVMAIFVLIVTAYMR